jgi:hypothetical protein
MLARAAFLLIVALGAGACAGARAIDVPSALPNVTRHDFLTLRWALLRQDGVARAVGFAESTGGGRWDASVDLLGLDGAGQVVSRGSTALQPGFAPGPLAFEMTLAETGRETDFRLRVTRAQQYARPSR